MTKRQEAFMYVAIAWSFAYSVNEKGIKGFKRAITNLQDVMDVLSYKLTDKQRKQVLKEVDKKITNETYGVYDFMDTVVNAMEIIKTGKERYLNSRLALAVTNVPEVIDDNNGVNDKDV